MKFYILPALLTASLASGAVVTLYDVVPTDPVPTYAFSRSVQVDGTTAYSAINPSDGSDVTTYEVEEIRTRVIVVEGDNTATSTYTVLATPTTVKYTRVEGQSQLYMKVSHGPSTPTVLPHFQYSFADTTTDCQLDINKKQGVCIQENVVPVLRAQVTTVSGTPTTITQIQTVTHDGTYTGALVPLATITTGGSPQRFTNALWSSLSSLVAISYSMYYLM